ncbi:MAG: hypothetical protein F4Z97_00515, partial [Gammaproteobacteria bacterium]|nr:hypothetical protein [Gammaproteobacteria bacterium]
AARLLLSASSSSTEGNSGSNRITYSVTVDHGNIALSNRKRFNYRVCFRGTATPDLSSDGSQADADYSVENADSTDRRCTNTIKTPETILLGSIPNNAVQSIRVNIRGDETFEPDETVTAVLELVGTPPANYGLGKAYATSTIFDDDTRVSVAVHPTSLREGANTSCCSAFFIKREASLQQNRRQDFKYQLCLSGSATPGSISSGDYYVSSRSHKKIGQNCFESTFPASQSDAFNDIQFGIVGDSAFEPDETLIATLKLINPPIGVQLGKDTATITIENDDSQKAVLSASFSINRKENRYDHNELDNGKNHKVPILLDVSQAVDKDGKRVPFPEIPVRLCVSNSGTAKYDKSQSPYKPTDADYRVMLDGNPLGIGTQCTDIVIPAGQNFSNRYGLFIFGDDWAEADETIITEISCAGQCPDGVELGSRRLTVNIIDNDGPATLSLNGPADANEGNTGSTDRLFKVALSSPVTAAITYDLCFSGNSTIDLSGASTIADGADYQPLSDGAPATSRCVRSNIPATTTSAAKSIGIRVRGDTTVERNETVTVSLNLVGQLPPGVARGAFSATHRIVNDETVVSFSASSSSLDEDDGAAAVTVGLSPAPTEDIMLHYAISGTAGEDEDFTLENSGTLTVRAGASEAFIEVVPVADSAVEADETVIFELKDSNGYVSGSAKRHVLTIANDDSATLSISAPDDAGEGNAGTTDRLFTISFSELVKKTVHYRVCFSSGTAVIDLTQADPIPVGADYQPLFTSDGALVPGTSRCLGGTHAGENAQVVVAPVGIRVKGDVGVEVDETVTATVSFVGAPPAGVSLGTDSATHTIVDDDRVIASIVAPPDNDEGNSGSTDRFFTVTLSKPTSNHVPLSVCFSGTAAIDLTQAAPIPAAADYQPLENGAAAGTRCVDGSVAANSVSQSVGIRVRGDADIERHETVVATLAFTETVPAGFAIDAHATTAAHRILDDDVAVSFAASSSQVLEGDRVHNVTLNIVPAAPADFTFDYTVDGTAVAGTDFTLADSGTISVKKGATEVTAAIMLIDNQKFESSKTLVLRLPDDVATAQVHEVKIINNDIGVTVDSMSRLESGSDSTSATDVTLTVR